MTVLCGGGTSGAKSISPGVVFLGGETLSALLVEVFALSDPWAALIAFAAAQSIDLSTFCSTDPPAMPTFLASDIPDIITANPFLPGTGSQKLNDLVFIAAWYAFCECKGAATPAPPPAPVYPTGGDQVNPPGFISTRTDSACWDKSATFQNNGGFLTHAPPSLYPPVPVGGQTDVNDKRSIDATRIVGYFSNNGDSAFTNGPIEFHSTYFTAAGATILTDITTVNANQLNVQYVSTPPPTWAIHQFVTYTPDGQNISTCTIREQLWCPGTSPISPNAPCCPPDPQLFGMLRTVLNALKAIYEEMPRDTLLLKDGTQHLALSGAGSIMLSAAVVGIRVDVVPQVPTWPNNPGVPAYYLSMGFITSFELGTPLKGWRLVYQSQTFPVQKYADQIGYTLPAGIQINITELLAT